MATYSGYKIDEKVKNPILRRLISLIMDITSGHDHDGTNSKAVTVGTVADGAIETAKIADAALSADAAGRAKMADGFITNAKIAADADIALSKLSATARKSVLSYQIEDLSAGADIANRVIFQAPSGIDVTLVSAAIIPQGSAAGVDDSNTCVIALADGSGNSIVSKTYNTGTAIPAAGVLGDLGVLDATYKALAAGEKLALSITNGTTANPPALMLQVVYTVADAA